MIKYFGNKLVENLYDDIKSKDTIRFSGELRRASRRKLLYLNDAEELKDLRVPPGNKLKKLRGEMKDYYSIRINDKWRITFKWENGNALDVKIVDYH